MQELAKLLFELSNEDRLRILTEIREKPQKMTHLATKAGWTVQETSRNLTRLEKASLITKNREGEFELSRYGEGALALLQGYEFLSRHEEYFSTHSISQLPDPWSTGLASLSESSHSDDILSSFHRIEEMIRDAKEYIWIISDQVLASTIPLISDAVCRNVEFKLVIPKQAQVPIEVRKMCAGDKNLVRAGKEETAKARFVDSLQVGLAMSEQSVGLLTFPTLDGHLDYRGFYSSGEKSHEWCASLFSHVWSKASEDVPRSLRS